jgi:chemotaxis-related protein WspD
MITETRRCWSRIGTWGDGSCPELVKAVHCRNCPVYSQGAVELLDRELPEGYTERWTRHFATAQAAGERGAESVVIFRIGLEWFALPTDIFCEVCDTRPVHSLPHRRDAIVRGVVNVRGELRVCVSLADLLGVDRPAAAQVAGVRGGMERFLVIQRKGERLVFSVDEVYGIHRYHSTQLRDTPATVARATASYTNAVLPWEGQTVGVLNSARVFDSLNRSLA